jgi:hypothetical protein
LFTWRNVARNVADVYRDVVAAEAPVKSIVSPLVDDAAAPLYDTEVRMA